MRFLCRHPCNQGVKQNKFPLLTYRDGGHVFLLEQSDHLVHPVVVKVLVLPLLRLVRQKVLAELHLAMSIEIEPAVRRDARLAGVAGYGMWSVAYLVTLVRPLEGRCGRYCTTTLLRPYHLPPVVSSSSRRANRFIVDSKIVIITYIN